MIYNFGLECGEYSVKVEGGYKSSYNYYYKEKRILKKEEVINQKNTEKNMRILKKLVKLKNYKIKKEKGVLIINEIKGSENVSMSEDYKLEKIGKKIIMCNKESVIMLSI
tara:strand:- start:125 stop:454 length:330 start_codon:yes stop_codon:yes gene_type:complete